MFLRSSVCLLLPSAWPHGYALQFGYGLLHRLRYVHFNVRDTAHVGRTRCRVSARPPSSCLAHPESYHYLLPPLFLFQGIPGFRPRTTRPFCFAKRPQNHIGRCMALRVPCAVHRHRRRANSRKSVLSLLEGLKHCPPFLRCRLHYSTMPPGQGILWKEKEDGSPITTVGDDGGVRRRGYWVAQPGTVKGVICSFLSGFDVDLC